MSHEECMNLLMILGFEEAGTKEEPCLEISQHAVDANLASIGNVVVLIDKLIKDGSVDSLEKIMEL